MQVDREMVFFFSVINEAATLFTKQNAGNDSGYPAPVYRHTINGEAKCCSFFRCRCLAQV